MTGFHIGLGIAVIALFLGAGLLGAWRWYRVEVSDGFWKLLRAAQALLVAEVAVGGVLLALGDRPAGDLHYVYGLLGLGVSFVAEQLRIAAAETVLEARGLESAQAVGALPAAEQRSVVRAIVRRELGVMTAAALVIVGLTLRAALGSQGV